MCGIAGYLSSEKFFNKEELEQMTNSLSHRGPDAGGYFSDEYISLGHRRLSILDLSEKANQPMHSANNRFVMVYNGEVYNYKEIAIELQQNFNVKFKTTSDSEVILEAYSHYGADFVEKLNGMFAIAIYDKHNEELFVCRDRIGIKPLYYFWDGKNFAFASELKALTALSQITLEINRNAVYQFLHLGFIPSPQSIYKSIKKLESGSWLKISKSNLESNKYWTANKQIKERVIKDEKEAIFKLNDLLKESVQYQINSDVPFGVFLSGGIDSSLISAIAANVSENKVNTFSIGFEENRYNESVYARNIANHLKTQHHEFIVSHTDAIELIDTVFNTYDEPFADTSAIPTMLVSKLAKQEVTVALSGDGGDELFLGYGAYQWAKRLNNPLIKIFSNSISSILSNSNSRFQRHSEYFVYPKNLQYSHILSQEQYYFSIREVNDLIKKDFFDQPGAKNMDLFLNFVNQTQQSDRELNSMEKQALFDLNFYLQDDLLTKIDRASMHFSLETRVPYLDHRIIELALNISPTLKYKNKTTKYLLKEILYKYVPKKMLDRPKQGFAIPLEKWLAHELRFLIEETLSKKVIELYGIVKYDYVERLKKDFFEGKKYHYNRLWLLIVLHRWLQKNHKIKH